MEAVDGDELRGQLRLAHERHDAAVDDDGGRLRAARHGPRTPGRGGPAPLNTKTPLSMFGGRVSAAAADDRGEILGDPGPARPRRAPCGDPNDRITHGDRL